MYQSRPGGLFKHIDFMILDLFCIWLVLWIAHFLRVGSMNMLRSYAYRSLFVIIALVHICVALFTASYKDILRRSRLREFAAVCEHVASVMVVTLMFLFFIKVTDDLSRMVMVSLIVFSVGALWCERLLWKKVVHHRLRTNPRLLLLVADRAGAKRIIARVQRSLDISVEGIVLTGGKNSGSIQGVPIVAEADGMEDYLRNHAIDEVIFSAHQDKPLQDSMIRKCRLMGLTIHTEMEISNEMPEVRYEENIAGITVMTGCMNHISPSQAAVKRIMDIAIALVGLVITAILFIFVAPAIYISDPGPIFFSQVRVGKNGRLFKMYKFRSMYQDAEKRKAELMAQNEMSGQMFKMTNDPRIIGSGPDGTRQGLGHFLRSTSIDEFPQFWNVLKGELAVCGWRPATPKEFEKYNLHHYARTAINPGMTGLWQVSGRSDITDFEEVVRLDTEYIQNWSIWLDIKIIFKTILVVFGRKGSR